MPGVIVALIILIIVALLIAVSCVKIVPQATCMRGRTSGRLSGNMVCRYSFQSTVYRPCGKESCIKRAGGRFPATAGYHKR